MPPRGRRARLARVVTAAVASALVVAGLSLITPGLTGPARAAALSGGGDTDLRVEVPHFHGIEPALALSYTEGGGNGWLGSGWSLTGLSQVARIGAERGLPAYNTEDRYLLDGADLLACPQAPAGLGCVHPSSAAVPIGSRYVTRVTSQQRIEYAPAPDGGTWTVWEGDGTRRTYRPRIVPQPVADPSSWHLAQVRDPVGNTVTYEYVAGPLAPGDTGIGQEYLQRISYNGTEITFQSVDRPDAVTIATGRELIVARRRLARIDVRTGGELQRSYQLGYRTPAATGTGNSVLASVRMYGRDAVLGPEGTVTSATSTNPIRISTTPVPVSSPFPVTGSGAPGSFSADSRQASPWAPPWPDNQAHSAESWDNQSSIPAGVRLGTQRWLTGDIDGDGRSDYVGVTLEKFPPDDPSAQFQMVVHVAMANAEGIQLASQPGSGKVNYRYASAPLGIWWSHDPATPFFHVLPGDLNGDGRTDLTIVGQESTSQRVFAHALISKGDGTFTVPPRQQLPINWSTRHRWFSGDVDGDGRADLVLAAEHPACDAGAAALTSCTVGATFEHAALVTWLSTGDGSWTTSGVQETGWSDLEGDSAHWFVGDADGDGRADVQRVVNHHPHGSLTLEHAAIQTAIALGDGHFRLAPDVEVPGPWQSWSNPLPWLDQQDGSDLVQAGDVNGDGMNDLVLAGYYSGNAGWRVRLVTAFSTGSGTYRTVEDRTDLTAQHLNFWWRTQAKQQTSPNRWLTGDWNGDGATDLLIASPDDYTAGAAQWPRTVSVTRLLSDRHGQWTIDAPPPTPFYFDCWDRPSTDPASPPACPNDLLFTPLAGDVNGDGADDFMYAGGKLSESMRTTYFRVQVAPVPTQDTRRWTPADVTGDGRRDLVYPQYARTGIVVHTLIRRRDGSWQHVAAPVLGSLLNPVARAWSVADVGSPSGGPDGRADLVHLVRDDSISGLRVLTLLSNGNGTWTERSGPALAPFDGRDAISWRLADVDGDGDADLVHLRAEAATGQAAHDLYLDVVRSDGNGSWTGLPSQSVWPGFGGDDVLSWRPMDIDGDGRIDFVHVSAVAGTGSARAVELRILHSRSDGTYARLSPAAIPGLDATVDPGGWRPAGVNGDRAADLVSVTAVGATIRVHSLLGDGAGTFTLVTSSPTPAATPQAGSTTRHWLSADVDGDGSSDLVHAAAGTTGTDLAVLHARGDGMFTLDAPTAGAARTLDAPDSLGWMPTDIGGDGRDDLVHVHLLHQAVNVTVLHSTSPRDLVTEVDNGLGAVTQTTWGSSADGLTGPGVPNSACRLPLGATLLVAAVTTQRLDGARVDEKRRDFSCPRWSFSQRRLLGWTTVTTTRLAAVNRPAQHVTVRQELGEQCPARPTDETLTDAQGRVATRTVTTYVPTGASPPYACRLAGQERTQLDGGASGLTTSVVDEHDALGNISKHTDFGSSTTADDDRVTIHTYHPAFGPWIITAPAEEELRGPSAIGSPPGATTLVRRTLWCYGGANGTPTGTCPGTPVADALPTASKRLGDDGKYRTTTSTYDTWGNLLTRTDPLGHRSTTTYDTVRRTYPVKQCNPLNECMRSEWNLPQGLLSAVVDPNGQRTGYSYDALGRPVATTRADGSRTTRSYLNWADPARRRIHDVAPDGSADGLWTDTYLDGLDRTTRIVAEGDQPGTQFAQVTFWTDASSHPGARTNWFGLPATPVAPATERFTYDVQGRMTAQQHADGSQLTWAYASDPTGSRTTARTETGVTRTLVRDGAGRLVGVRESDGIALSTLAYRYDAADQLRLVTDDHGTQTVRRYDLLGRLAESTDPDLGRWTWTWDDADRLATRTDARGRTVRYGYDAADRPTTTTYTGGDVVTRHYGEAGHGKGIGRLTSISDPTGVGCAADRSRASSYDALGRVSSTTYCVDGDSRTMGFEFDHLDRPSAVVYPGNERVTYGYDPAGRLRDMSGLIGEFTYNADGQLLKAEAADSTISTWTWDTKRHWLTSSSVDSPVTGNLLTLGYTHGLDGLVQTSSSAPGGPNLSYTYDGLQRLTDVTGDLTQHLTWDTTGNVKTDTATGTFTYPVPGPQACTGAGSATTCTHPHAASAAGSQSYDYDANGNTLAVHTRLRPARSARDQVIVRPGDTLSGLAREHLGRAARWRDLWILNRTPALGGSGQLTDPDLIRVGQPILLPVARPTITRRLDWDDENRLVMVQDGTSPGVRMRYDADGQRVEKRQGDVITHWFGPWLEETYPGPGPTLHYLVAGRPIAQRDDRGLHFAHTDLLGSTRLLTTGTGDVSGRFSYRPFGQPLATSGSTTSAYGFTGARQDSETGLALLGARHYDPGHARFLSPDTEMPDATSTQAANRYLYAYGNPLSWTDLSGHDPDNAAAVVTAGPPDGPGMDPSELTPWPYDPEQPPVDQPTAPPLVTVEQSDPSVFSSEYWQDVWHNYWWYLNQLDAKQEAYDREHDLATEQVNNERPLLKYFPLGATDDPVEREVVARIGPRPSNILGDIASIYTTYLALTFGLGPARPAGAALAPGDETISVFHGSLNNASEIRAGGLVTDEGTAFVSRDVNAARDAVGPNRPNYPGSDPGIVESRIPRSIFDEHFAPNERPYSGFYPYQLNSTEIPLRAPEQIKLFNDYIVRTQ